MSSPWIFSAFLAPSSPEAAAEPIARIRELRARILFDGGRRPAFLAEDGGHTDAQPQDHGAWHFVARRAGDGPDGPPLGYVRLLTPETGYLFQSREFLGAQRYEALLRGEGLRIGEVFEHSRLVVEPRARKLGLGVQLNALAIAVAHELGAKAMIGTSGTADGQDRFHERFGFRAVPGTRRYVERFTEDVVILLHRVSEGAGEYTDLVAELRRYFSHSDHPGTGVITVGERRRSSRANAAPPRELTRIGPADPGRYKPLLFVPLRERDRAALSVLLASGDVHEVCDTIDLQLEELIRSREPGRWFDESVLEQARRDQLDGVAAWNYGTWVWYPWSGRLVHVLPREEYRLVRTDRNRGKIDRPDQRRLLDKRIGVVGLSVGNSAAAALAQEGVAGSFKLADFDTLGLSNLNRLRAGVHDLGVNKTAVAARQLAEIDPYLDIEVFPDGLTEDNLKEFFLGGDGPIDLLVEECDTPWVKLAAREKARELGVPVVMDCNDRGLLDIERFDQDPHRPLLHGRLGSLSADDLLDATVEDRIGLILAMVDAQRISPALAASVPEIGRTLSSWPQLASGVALGGALVVEAARRILLGDPCESGRFYVDLEELIRPDRDQAGVRSFPTAP